jgi:hypothetical protein
MEVSRDLIKKLMEDVRAIHESPQNQARAAYWHLVPPEEWEPALIRTLPRRGPAGKIPFVCEPALAMWSQILDFDLRAYYHDPLVYLTAQLEMKIYHAQHFKDDTFIDKSFRLMFATLLEGSMLGVTVGFTRQGHPWLDYLNPPVKSGDDLERLESPDFYRSGIMPALHRFYAEMNEALDDDFLVKFPDWIMGPFGVACELRGFDQFLVDLILDPEFARRLLRSVVEARKSWQAQCDRFLGVERTRGLLGNDDVNCPTLSPALYRDVILPYEVELSDHYGGIFYWHSCGDTTRLLDDVAHIPILDLFHCGPWTEVGKAGRVVGGRGVPLEICPDPVNKVQMVSPADQKRHLEDLATQVPADVNCYVKIDSLEVVRDLATELASIQNWITMAREVLG